MLTEVTFYAWEAKRTVFVFIKKITLAHRKLFLSIARNTMISISNSLRNLALLDQFGLFWALA